MGLSAGYPDALWGGVSPAPADRTLPLVNPPKNRSRPAVVTLDPNQGQGHADQARHHADHPEPDRHLRFRPPQQLEVVL